MKILFTAAEIARMRLPGLPTTKSSILSRAAREGWRYEEQYGIGGIRRVFEIPDRYLVAAHGAMAGRMVSQNTGCYLVRHDDAGKDAAALDAGMLAEAAQVLEKWDLDERVGLSADEKGRLIALCYKMLADGAVSGDLSALLAAVTRVVRDGSNV